MFAKFRRFCVILTQFCIFLRQNLTNSGHFCHFMPELMIDDLTKIEVFETMMKDYDNIL